MPCTATPLPADGTHTVLCAWLSAALLVGLMLNAAVGLAWADHVAGLVITAVAARDAIRVWRRQNCCASTGERDPAATDVACD